MPSKRLFIGIPIPLELKESISNIKKGYLEVNGIRWTQKENLHITLIFIGNVELNQIEQLIQYISEVIDRSKSFTLNFSSLKTIKNRNIPLMFWAAYEKDRRFDELHEVLFHSIQELVSLKKDQKENIPHITMARLKVSKPILIPPLPDNIILPDVEVDKIVLWESTLLPDGPVYDPIQIFKLQ